MENYLAKEFLNVAPFLLYNSSDHDLRLRERTMIVSSLDIRVCGFLLFFCIIFQCIISLCETFEQMPEYGSEWFNYACSNECALFNAYFKCMIPDDLQLQKLIELTKGDRTLAEERQEDILHLGVAILAAFTYLPIHIPEEAEEFKFKVFYNSFICSFTQQHFFSNTTRQAAIWLNVY